MSVKWVAFKDSKEGGKNQHWLDANKVSTGVLYPSHKKEGNSRLLLLNLPNKEDWLEWDFYVDEVLTTEGAIPTEVEKGIASMMGYKFYIEEQHSD